MTPQPAVDNLPLVLQEALVGGVPDLIRHGETGLLAEPENPADLAAKIAELLPDAPRRATMSTRARQVAKAEYDIRDITRKYIDLYQALLA